MDAMATAVCDIDLFSFYDSIGLGIEYQDAVRRINLPADDSVWYVVVLKGMTPAKMIQGYKAANLELVNRYAFSGWENVISHNDRDPNSHSYVVSFPRSIEADQEYRDLSGYQVDYGYHGSCITFLERGILGAGFWHKSKGHLDIVGLSLCAGTTIKERNGDEIEIRHPYIRLGRETKKNLFGSIPTLQAGQTVAPRFLISYDEIK